MSACSTHPLTDAWDFFKPGKLGPTTVTPYGGVAIPQGPIVPVAPNFPGPAFPSAPVIPGPAPLPGTGVELQPPLPPPPPAKF
ncbi:MAG: hypothetical protein EXR98_06295 [Gemmataceae bacterium]|nr:hypothetical protein [Gemmataceae bacterium]